MHRSIRHRHVEDCIELTRSCETFIDGNCYVQVVIGPMFGSPAMVPVQPRLNVISRAPEYETVCEPHHGAIDDIQDDFVGTLPSPGACVTCLVQRHGFPGVILWSWVVAVYRPYSSQALPLVLRTGVDLCGSLPLPFGRLPFRHLLSGYLGSSYLQIFIPDLGGLSAHLLVAVGLKPVSALR